MDNYIHDMGYMTGDHLDGIASDAGKRGGLTIEHNTVLDQFRTDDRDRPVRGLRSAV